MDSIFTWIGVVLMAFSVGMASRSSGESEGKEQIRQEAVKAGVAHYVADKDGKPTFTWNKVESGLVVDVINLEKK